MSQANVETVRKFVDCWTRQDWPATDGLLDPDVELHPTVGGLDQGRVLHGVEAIRREYVAVDEMWDVHRVELEELIDAGDRVVLFQHEYQRGKSSGVELEIDAAVVFELRDGRIVRMQGYLDRAAALEAAGLSPGSQRP